MADIIKDITKNNSEIIRIEVSEFKGRELINIRIWYHSIGPNGDVIYKPTQKGITLNINEYLELKDGIDRLGVYIDDKKSGTEPEQPGDPQNTGDEEEKSEKENLDV